MSILGKIGYGGITTVIGLIIVFTGLIIIIACLYAMAAIFKKINSNKARKAEALKAAEPQPVQGAGGRAIRRPAAAACHLRLHEPRGSLHTRAQAGSRR